jgi:hypothetical protein
VVLNGCKTLFLTLREENRLRVLENRKLRRIFRPKSDEVTGIWRKLHKEALHNLYSSPSVIRMMNSRKMRWTGNGARTVRMEINIEYLRENIRKETIGKTKT